MNTGLYAVSGSKKKKNIFNTIINRPGKGGIVIYPGTERPKSSQAGHLLVPEIRKVLTKPKNLEEAQEDAMHWTQVRNTEYQQNNGKVSSETAQKYLESWDIVKKFRRKRL